MVGRVPKSSSHSLLNPGSRRSYTPHADSLRCFSSLPLVTGSPAHSFINPLSMILLLPEQLFLIRLHLSVFRCVQDSPLFKITVIVRHLQKSTLTYIAHQVDTYQALKCGKFSAPWTSRESCLREQTTHSQGNLPDQRTCFCLTSRQLVKSAGEVSCQTTFSGYSSVTAGWDVNFGKIWEQVPKRYLSNE